MHSRTFAPGPVQSTITITPSKPNQANGGSPFNTSIIMKNNDSAEGFDDGPTFKQALRAFQGDGNSSVTSNASYTTVNRSLNESNRIMTSTTQQIQRTMHTTSSNKSYHVEES